MKEKIAMLSNEIINDRLKVSTSLLLKEASHYQLTVGELQVRINKTWRKNPEMKKYMESLREKTEEVKGSLFRTAQPSEYVFHNEILIFLYIIIIINSLHIFNVIGAFGNEKGHGTQIGSHFI